jgi:hypothetical protein
VASALWLWPLRSGMGNGRGGQAQALQPAQGEKEGEVADTMNFMTQSSSPLVPPQE